MTAVLDAPADLTRLADDELAAMYAGADEATVTALTAECNRRDRAARIAAYRVKAQARSRAIREEWREFAWSQYSRAEADTRGYLLSEQGKREVDEPFTLWSGPESRAMRLASEELRNWWDENGGRLTLTAYLRQRATAARIQRDEREGEHMETTGHAGAPALAPGELAARSAARKARLNDARDRMGIPRPDAAVAVRPGSTVAGTGSAPQIDGAALLGYVRAFIGRFTYLSPAQADAVALWIGHTHARDEEGYLSWAASPRLYALSSKPGSGKSTLLEHCGRLCPATFGLDTEPTEAGLVYTISKEHATVLLDEGDVLFASGRRKSAVRAVINSGYTPNGTTLKIKSGKGERVRIYGALALAALDVVEKATGGTMEATLSRGVRIIMIQAPEDYEIPEMTRTDEMNAAKLKMVLEKWGTGNRDEMAGLAVEVPDGIRNRQAQIWKTLLRVGLMADVTHQRMVNDPEAVPPGGSWYERAFAACQALALAGADDDADRTADMMDELAADLGGWDVG